MPKPLLPPDAAQWFRGHAAELSNREAAVQICEKYGIECTYKQVGAYRKRYKIASGPRSKAYTKVFPCEVATFIEANMEGTPNAVMLDMIREKFGREYSDQQLHTYKTNHHIKNGIKTQFKKGHIQEYHPPKTPEAKERSKKSHFKKGQKPHNAAPIGGITRHSHDNYLMIKVAEHNKWELLQRYVWEQAYGPIPEGHKIVFLDGNIDNVDLSNLACLSGPEYAEYNMRLGGRGQDKEFTKAKINVARIKCKVRDIKKSKGEQCLH